MIQPCWKRCICPLLRQQKNGRCRLGTGVWSMASYQSCMRGGCPCNWTSENWRKLPVCSWHAQFFEIIYTRVRGAIFPLQLLKIIIEVLYLQTFIHTLPAAGLRLDFLPYFCYIEKQEDNPPCQYLFYPCLDFTQNEGPVDKIRIMIWEKHLEQNRYWNIMVESNK